MSETTSPAAAAACAGLQQLIRDRDAEATDQYWFDQKVPLVLFSGGLDSTYLVYELLKHSPVDVVYCNADQHTNKIEAERIAREKIIAEFDTLNTRFKVRNQYEADRFSLSQNPAVLFQQPPAWIFGALSVIDPRKHSSLEVGYVSGDCALTYRHEMTRAWNALNELCLSENLPLKMQLMRWTKQDILGMIPDELRKLVWICELPKADLVENAPIQACGTCAACERWEYEQMRFDRKRARDDAIMEALDSPEPSNALEILQDSGMQVTVCKVTEEG